MYYLIQTPYHPRPYLSSVSFVANDFAQWGCRVTRHAKGSPYITEIRYQETINRPTCRRVELMDIWVKEVLARKHQGPPPTSTNENSIANARKGRASAFVQDFISSLPKFGAPGLNPNQTQSSKRDPEGPAKVPKPDALPISAYPLVVVTCHTRLLKRCAYTTHAVLPSWTVPEVLVADQITLEFRFDKNLKREQLAHALVEAVGRGKGRMGRVEKCLQTGVTKVFMWVDVGDLVMSECGKGEVWEEDPVPVYDRGEWIWPPGYEEVEC
ncbi:hypothetical protein SVAN01_05384 [Stagonosporopsis vannaccii]|nr:hypothetical protein SVAN01_05384 [Stagonosporopsis vannaccii]